MKSSPRDKSIKSKLIKKLKNNNDHLSGEILSRELGVSRTAVWKCINELRSLGYQIESYPRRGYQLKYTPDLLIPEEISLNLNTRYCGRNIYHYTSLPSTNQLACELGRKSEPEGTLVVAEEQTAGRGRRGRNWFSPPGKGIWMSLLFYPHHLAPIQMAPFTAAAAAIIAGSLRRSTGIPVVVKWPNDLMVNHKKVGGILSEIQGDQEQIHFLVLGTGINVNQDPTQFPPDIQPIATSLSYEAKTSLQRVEICRLLLEDLEEGYQQFLREGFVPFREKWIKHNSTLGRRVTLAIGNRRLEGWAQDLDEQGALLLKDDTGDLHRLSYGELVDE